MNEILRQRVKGRRIDAPVLEQMFKDKMKRKGLQPLAPNIRCKFNNLVNCNSLCGKDVRAPPVWCTRWRKHHKYFKGRR